MRQRMINGFHVGGYAYEHRRHLEHFGKSEAQFNGMIELARSIEGRVKEYRESRDLTPEGQNKAIRQWVQSEVVPKIKAAANVMKTAQAYGASKRSGLTFQKADKTDIAAAMVRSDLRREVRSWDPAKRNAALIGPNLDPEIAMSILEAPAILSGVTETQRQRLQDRAVLAANPEAGKEILDLDGASASVARAIRAASKSVAKYAGVPEHELGEMLGEPGLRERLRSMVRGDSADDADDEADAEDGDDNSVAA